MKKQCNMKKVQHERSEHQKSATWKQKCKYEKNVTRKINMKKVKVEKSAAQRKHEK